MLATGSARQGILPIANEALVEIWIGTRERQARSGGRELQEVPIASELHRMSERLLERLRSGATGMREGHPDRADGRPRELPANPDEDRHQPLHLVPVDVPRHPDIRDLELHAAAIAPHRKAFVRD